MARPKSYNAFYFPHFTKREVELKLIEHKHGAEGYRAYYRIHELVADTEFHKLSVSTDDEKLMFELNMNGDSEVIEDVIRILIDKGRIDRELWENERIIWMDKLVRDLRPVWSKRGRSLPTKNDKDVVSGSRNLQKRKEKKRKEK